MKSRSGRFDDEDVQSMTPLPVVPLIDCFVLILIFFLATATLTKPHKALDIRLPHSAAAIKTASKHSTLIITMTKDGTVYIESEPMSRTLLHKRLREIAAQNPNRKVRLEADRTTPFQYIVYVLDLLQFEGLRDVGVRTRE